MTASCSPAPLSAMCDVGCQDRRELLDGSGSAAGSPDHLGRGRLLAIGSWDSTATLWDVAKRALAAEAHRPRARRQHAGVQPERDPARHRRRRPDRSASGTPRAGARSRILDLPTYVYAVDFARKAALRDWTTPGSSRSGIRAPAATTPTRCWTGPGSGSPGSSRRWRRRRSRRILSSGAATAREADPDRCPPARSSR